MKPVAFPLLRSVLVAFVGLLGVTDCAIALSTTSVCQPPEPNEYLLFVLSQSRESQEQIQRTLPANAQFSVCRYLDDTVTRVAGFRRLEDADRWARYVRDIVGLSAYVVRPSSAKVFTSPAYNPQPLGDGYAVLVDYFNQPELAAQVQKIVGDNVGLVSFGQRPYLLAMYTTNQRKANSTLRELSDRGFWSMVVDSRRVTLLRSKVSF